MNKWQVTDEIKAKFIPMLKEYFGKVESLTEEQSDNVQEGDLALELTDVGINPYQLRVLLEEEFGYERTDSDRNGWELDFWIYMRRTDGKTFPSGCQNMVISGCGMTFTLVLDIKY